ncbi:MAG: PAS domain S-box protein [Myxococcota bacterium]|nr:PAS domain S-box protein [Myxococcota bacterium]
MSSSASLISRISVALAGADAESALARALELLAEAGYRTATESDERAWLEVSRADRALRLTAADSSSDELRDALSGLLGLGLERAASEEELRRVRERYDMLSAASFEGLMINVDGVVIDANERLAEMTGYTLAEMIGPETMRRCCAPEDLPDVMQRLRDRYEGTYMISAVRKDGSRFRAELQSKQGKLGEKPVRVVAVRDVTERERTLALLAESEKQLRSLAEQAFDFWTVSRDGIALFFGGAFTRVLGYQSADVVGRPLLEITAPPSRPIVSEVLAEHRPGAYRIELLAADGEYVPAEVVGVASTLGGERVRIAGVRDLRAARKLEEENKRLEQHVMRSQRLESLAVLAGGIAHDFNNLLVGVLGNAELLQAGLERAEDRELCEAIAGAARHAADLTNQLLTYAGQRELGPKQPIDLTLLAEELRASCEARWSKTVKLELALCQDSVVLGERGGLAQVLTNLVNNAAEAIGDRPGTIRLTTARVESPEPRWEKAHGAKPVPGNWLQIDVIDDGAGILPKHLEQVFDPFFTTKAKGQGLGLPTSLGIVQAHGGALLAESEPGGGSRFSLLLPSTPRPDSTAHVDSAAAKPRRRVLVIDDEAIVRTLLRRSLERKGFEVMAAADGESGIALIREQTPDLVVLDMTMPEVDGAEVVRRVRGAGITVPIVIASGHLDLSAEMRLPPGSYQAFLSKPFSVSELLKAVELALARSPIAEAELPSSNNPSG